MKKSFVKTAILFALLILLAAHAQGLVAPGRITVYSTPSGALACIDSVTCDTTTATFSVDGNAWHTVVVTAKGYVQWSDTVYVISDQTSVVNTVLDLNPSVTGIQVFMTPGGGTVCLDYNQCNPNIGTLGTTGSTQFTGMQEGYHTITVTGVTGYQDYSAPVYVTMGSFTTININLVPAGSVTPTPITTPVFTSSGTIRVYIDRLGSTVCIDNGGCQVNIGGNPGPGTGTTLFNRVDPGTLHTVNVTAEGFVPFSAQVSVIKDQISTVDVHLVPLVMPTTTPTTLATTPSPSASQTSVPIPTPLPTTTGLDAAPVIGALGLCCIALLYRKSGRK